MRVLVIEDDVDVTLLYRLALEHAGHDVETVALGREGLRRALEDRPDVIVLDGMLPDIDGMAVLTALGGDASTASIPVVMASARVGGSDQRAALDGGASAYVIKPFEPAYIAAVVDRVHADRMDAAPAGAAGTVMEAPVLTAEDAELIAELEELTALDESPIQRTEPNLTQVLSLAFDAIVSVDDAQRIVGFNKGAEVTFGYLAEEVLGKPLDLLIPDRLVEVHRRHLRSYAAEPGSGRLMGGQRYVYARRRDGSEFPAEASITKLEIDGQPVLTAILRDATDRQRVEGELRTRALQQQAVADLGLRAITTETVETLIDDAVATVARVLDVDLVQLSLRDAAGELVMRSGSGWDPGLVGTARCRVTPGSLGHLTLTSDAPVVFEDITADSRFPAEAHLAQHGVVSGLHIAIRGRNRPVGLIGVYSRARRAFTDDDVYVVRAIANVVASAVQRDSHERRLRAYLDAAPDATVVVDLDGRIVSANAQAEVLFGYRREELLRLGVDALVPDTVRTRHSGHRSAYAAERRARAMGEGLVLSARRRDGTEVPVEIMLRSLDTDEGPLVVAAVRDVTDRRRNEAAREAFLHAVSHELRTPLTSVLGFSALLTDRYADEMPADALDLARRVRTSATKLERLLGDMLDLDRLGRGVLDAQRRDVGLLDLLRHCMSTLHLEGRELSVSVEPPDLRAFVDGAQVERIVENLVVNAVRHTPPLASIEVRVRQSANGILLVVEDDGPGVPADKREQIFEPFRRDATPGTAGTGIGLSLVARFAELHGGRAWVEDRPGGGASFRVVLAT
jgi:protein-histidine pros-kinase